MVPDARPRSTTERDLLRPVAGLRLFRAEVFGVECQWAIPHRRITVQVTSVVEPGDRDNHLLRGHGRGVQALSADRAATMLTSLVVTGRSATDARRISTDFSACTVTGRWTRSWWARDGAAAPKRPERGWTRRLGRPCRSRPDRSAFNEPRCQSERVCHSAELRLTWKSSTLPGPSRSASPMRAMRLLWVRPVDRGA
jgi:hypothetical protein